jgi:hypothetical protein
VLVEWPKRLVEENLKEGRHYHHHNHDEGLGQTGSVIFAILDKKEETYEADLHKV